MKLFTQTHKILRLGLGNEFSDKERLISPILFAILFVVLLWFSFGELPEVMGVRVYVAEIFLALFFALQLSFVRIFEPELEDGALHLYRTIPISPVAIFLGKLAQVFLISSLTTLATATVGTIFLGRVAADPLNASFLAVLALVLLGLSGIGVFLSSLTAGINAKQVLFPILFFPLTVPVLLTGVQCSIHILDGTHTLGQLSESWLGLLIVFDLIYCTLGLLFFDVMMKSN